MTLVFGRLEHDPAKLATIPQMLDYVADKSDPADTLHRRGVIYTPRLGDNGVDPDCTAESLRECATAAAAVFGGYELNVARTAALAFYCQCVGLPQNATAGQIQATEGAEMLLVAQKQWYELGFDTGYDSLRGQFGTIPKDDRLKLAKAAASFGLVWAGVRLYQNDEDLLYTSRPWDDDGSSAGDLIGRHALCIGWEYEGLEDSDEVTIVTYGVFKKATWRWVVSRIDEAHVFYWRQINPAGLKQEDSTRLENDLQQMLNAA